MVLPNPERKWKKRDALTSIDRNEVQKRIGKFSGELELLSGGRQNTNVRVGDDLVLRIYRRHPEQLQKEAALLGIPWESFVVPKLREIGPDFLLLEYIEHSPLEPTKTHGSAVGRALSEIHARRFDRAGFLGPDLTLEKPFVTLIDGLLDHLNSLFESDTESLVRLKNPVMNLFAKHNLALRQLSKSPVLLHADFKISNLHWTNSNRILVLDWEYAFAGVQLWDAGQLTRWLPGRVFTDAFATSYRHHGGYLPSDWQQWACRFDLVNLLGLLATAEPASRRSQDLHQKIQTIVDLS